MDKKIPIAAKLLDVIFMQKVQGNSPLNLQ